MISVTPARATDLAPAAAILAEAFAQDPVMSAVVPGSRRRHERLTDLFHGLLASGPYPTGTVDLARDADGTILGVAAWEGPHAERGGARSAGVGAPPLRAGARLARDAAGPGPALAPRAPPPPRAALVPRRDRRERRGPRQGRRQGAAVGAARHPRHDAPGRVPRVVHARQSATLPSPRVRGAEPDRGRAGSAAGRDAETPCREIACWHGPIRR